MGTSVISQWFFSKAPCSLYGKEEKKIREKSTPGRGDHCHSCVEGAARCERDCPRAKVESLTFQFRDLASLMPFTAVGEAVPISISLCKEKLRFLGACGGAVPYEIVLSTGLVLVSACSIPQQVWNDAFLMSVEWH